MENSKKKVLITDDSEINRSILSDMLGEEFEIIEAENGIEAISVLQTYNAEIALVLLDIVMPEMDGFEVLALMNKNHWIEDIPVIMITAENAPFYVERAYDLGVTDFITRPFDGRIVYRRAVNTIMLYSKQKKLVGLVEDQIYEKEKRSNLMIEILSNIVEFRNGESGTHVLHIHVLTELLLGQLIRKTNSYKLTRSEISLIGIASALHDIGKIAIPESILNKPSKLTYDEFEMIKTHALIGADMLKNLPLRQQEPLVKVAYQICRWHHERYDGKGYPDGLVGDEIPISAQVVALADVYDALTSRRVYKEAYTHERALKMIFDGECGSFNPLLLECLKEASDTIQNELKINSLSAINKKQMRNVANEMLQHEELSASERTLRLLEHERTKYQFFASMSNEIQFEYMLFPSMLSVSEWGAKQLGINEFVINPCKDKAIKALFKSGDLARLANALKKTTPTTPVIQGIYQLKIRDEVRWYKLIARSMWSSEETPKYVGAIGKLVDVNDEQMKISTLEKLALQDTLTGLYNQETVKKKIEAELKENPDAPYAMIIIDLDRFKSANDNFGHLFGNEILRYVARQIRDNLRPGELAARVGGDEFVVFVRGQKELEERIRHFFDVLSENRDNYKISVSMGVSLRGERNGSYEKLFHEADQALYVSKRAGRGMYRFYNKKMKDLFSAISPIDDEKAAEGNEEK